MDKAAFASSVAEDLAKNKRYAAFRSDATFLDFLMQLWEQVAPLLTGCFASPKEAAESAMQETLIGRFRRARLNKLVRDEIDDYGMSDELTTPLVGSILKVVAAS